MEEHNDNTNRQKTSCGPLALIVDQGVIHNNMKHKVHQQYYCIKYRALALRVGQDVIHNKMKHKVHQQQYYRALALIVDQGVILNSTT